MIKVRYNESNNESGEFDTVVTSCKTEEEATDLFEILIDSGTAFHIQPD